MLDCGGRHAEGADGCQMLKNGISPGLQQLYPHGLTPQLHHQQAHLMCVALDRHAVCTS